MEQVRVERLDHLGLIASVIKDIGLIDMIDGVLCQMSKRGSRQAKPWPG